ncbi:MAG TPA: polysaccharide deacetylase family protein [Clostridiaceae bacterium]
MLFNDIKMKFPLGKAKCLTLSYDDGVLQDKKLIQILNKYNIKATFNLNSGMFGQVDSFIYEGKKVIHNHVAKEEIPEVYKGHEVAIHTVSHPHLENLTKIGITSEVFRDKQALEDLLDYPVRGMAYPYGTYNDAVVDVLKSLEVEYSRTTKEHHGFYLPEDTLRLEATCHHAYPKLMELGAKFLKDEGPDMKLFYLWGHSYEFDTYDNWSIIENLSSLLAYKLDIWYATNIEVFDYLKALKELKFSCNAKSVYNPTGLILYFTKEDIPYEIKPGSTILL